MRNRFFGRYFLNGIEKMKFPLLKKEIKSVFGTKTSLIYFFLLLSLVAYGFYSAVDLYSKASVAAVGNPLYATGFEPVPGIFAPTLGALFIIFSIMAPFVLIRPIGDEKKNNTLPLLYQLNYSAGSLFLTKIFSAFLFILVSILFSLPLFFFWHSLGGHIPLGEVILLMSGYFLYGMFVVAVSFFSSALFESGSQASIFSLSVIMFSWFVDFGKEMNIIPFLNKISDFTVTKQLKIFERGILSAGSVLYFMSLVLLFAVLAFIFFDINTKRRTLKVVSIFSLFLIMLICSGTVMVNYDVSESGRNSFSTAETEFLKTIPGIDIEIFLEPTDGRFKDYENDFLKKLRMVKDDLNIVFAEGESLSGNYGKFGYSINGKRMETYSNSTHEIFMVLEDLSGKSVNNKDNQDIRFSGYPLVVKEVWSGYFFTLYLIVFPLMILLFYYRKDIFYGRKKG